jgi:hypothetical protein
MNNDKTKKIIIIFAIIDVALALSYGGLFFMVQQKNAQTSEIYSTLNRRASDKGALSRLEKSLADTEQQRALLSNYLITPEQTLSFIEQIESLGKKSLTDVKVTSVSSPKKTGDPFLLDFTAQGKFEDIYRLFSLLEEIPFRISIKNAAIAVDTQAKQTPPLWNATFTIVLDSYQG